jgi:L-arabinose isomerase
MTHADNISPNAQQVNGSTPRVGLLVIGRKRPGFDQQWGAQIEKAAWDTVGRMPLNAFRPQTRVTDDKSLREALNESVRAGCDALLVLQPTMGDGRLAPILAQLWERPLVFWATPERPDGDRVSSCSLVGTHLFASIFRKLKRPFELAYGHPNEARTFEQLALALKVSIAAGRLRQTKVGLVGNHAPGFVNMAAEPCTVSRDLGAQLCHFSLEEFYQLVESQDERAVRHDVQRTEAMSLPLDDGLRPDELLVNSAYYLALRCLLHEENLDGLALRCWPELPNRFGQWPYLAMTRLADEGQAVALEGDVDGAICCLIGRLLGAGVGCISDWLEHDDHTITLWHTGHSPREMCEPASVRLGRHFNNDKPVVVNATLSVNRPLTLFRLWPLDGKYHMTACNVRTIAPRRKLLGMHGLVIVEDRDVHQWFDALCQAGMPHHVTLLPGHHTDTLKRLARHLGLVWLSA